MRLISSFSGRLDAYSLFTIVAVLRMRNRVHFEWGDGFQAAFRYY